MEYVESYYPGIADCDRNWKVSPSAILSLLEGTSVHHTLSVSRDIAQGGVSWVLMQWRIRFLKRPVFGQKLSVVTWAREGSESSAYTDFVVKDGKGEECVLASAKVALVDIAKGARLPITEDIIKAFGTSDKPVFDDPMPRLAEDLQYESSKGIALRRSDIDFNGHVHNVRYLDFALEALPEEVYAKGEFKGVDIVYRSPLIPSETPDVKLHKGEGEYSVGIFSGSRVCALVRFLV